MLSEIIYYRFFLYRMQEEIIRIVGLGKNEGIGGLCGIEYGLSRLQVFNENLYMFIWIYKILQEILYIV